MVKISNENKESLKRFTVAGIHLITSIAEQLGLRAILSEYIAPYGMRQFPWLTH
jgi:hypothetical protein